MRLSPCAAAQSGFWRRRVPALLKLVAALDPDAVCTINDVKQPARALPSRPRRSWAFLPDALKITKRK